MKNIIQIFFAAACLFLTCSHAFADIDSAALPVNSFWPTNGPPGAVILLFGTNLDQVTGVAFGKAIAGFQVSTNKQDTLTAPVWLPSGAAFIATVVPPLARSGPIYIATPAGSGAVPGIFTVDSPLPLPPSPVINSFWPTNGVVGTPVTIAGDHFNGALAVQFNGVNSRFNVVSNSLVVANVPPQAASGPITVFTSYGTNIYGYWFTVDKPVLHRQ